MFYFASSAPSYTDVPLPSLPLSSGGATEGASAALQLWSVFSPILLVIITFYIGRLLFVHVVSRWFGD